MAEQNYQYGYPTRDENYLRILGNAFAPTRYPVLEPARDVTSEIEGATYQRTIPALLGEPEVGFEYMPAYRAVRGAGKFLGGLLTGGDEEREAVYAAAAGLPGAIAGGIEDYATSSLGALEGYDGMITPEGERIGYNPLLPAEFLLGGSLSTMRQANTLGALGGSGASGPKVYTDPVTGAVVTADDIALVDDLPVLGSPEFPAETLLGSEVRPFTADRMDAGRFYGGFPESPLEMEVPLQGGDQYANMASSRQKGVTFASLGEGTATTISGVNPPYGPQQRRFAVATQMDPTTHRSNITIGGRIIPMQVRAFIRDGIIDSDQAQQLDDLIRSKAIKKRGKDKLTGDPLFYDKLADFPGFMSDDIFRYMSGLDFETRGEIGKILSTAAARKLNAPSVDRILRETISPQAAGMGKMQGGILMELDTAPTSFTKGEPGSSISYDYEIKGRPVAKIPQGVDAEVFFEDLFARMRGEGRPETSFPYLLQKYNPKETQGESLLGNLPSPSDAELPLYSRRQARLLMDTIRGNWRDTSTLVNDGGLSPTIVESELLDNAMSASLTPYSAQALKAGAKDGSLVFYGLGKVDKIGGKQTGDTGGRVYFGLKKGTNYENEYGFSHPDLTNNETAVVGLVNNEVGGSAKGLAGPAAILKALEEGATVLDAYAVPSKANPNGFLPSYYKEFGFEELGRKPFEEKYVRDPAEGGSEEKYKKLLAQWRASGWDESMGMPDMTIMKWRGNEDVRTGATQRFVTEGGANFGGKNKGIVSGAESISGESTGSGVRVSERGRIEGDAGGNTGSIRDGNRTPVSSGFQRSVGAIPKLSPGGRRSLGLLDEDVAEIKSLLGM